MSLVALLIVGGLCAIGGAAIIASFLIDLMDDEE
jgi:hypothetical protein